MTDVDTLDSRAVLGNAALPDDELAAIARTAVGDAAAEIVWWRAEPVDYPAGTPSTGALLRVRGAATTRDGRSTDWSVFVKVLRSPALWPFLHVIPPAARDEFLRLFPWRLEVAAHQSGVDALLPPTLRLPRLYRVVEIDEHHTALWMEDVRTCPATWDLQRFERAAYALGQLAARRRVGAVAPFLSDRVYTTPGVDLRYYVKGRVMFGAMGALTAPETWQHPVLARAVADCGDPSLHDDLLAAAERVPELFDRLDALPQTYGHGDASPQNLLVAADDPERFVVIDWGFCGPLAVGFDLGQLLIGLAHAGELDAADLPAVHETILPAYVAGLRAEGMQVADEDVREGYLASLVLRSGFTALPLEELGDPRRDPDDPAVQALWCARVRLTRYLLDLAATLR